MADDDRRSPPRKRARFNDDVSPPPPPQRRENANASRGDAHGLTSSSASSTGAAPAASASASATAFSLSDRDRASLFFRTFLTRMATPLLQYAPCAASVLQATATASDAAASSSSSSTAVHDVARAVVAAVDGAPLQTREQEATSSLLALERTPRVESSSHHLRPTQPAAEQQTVRQDGDADADGDVVMATEADDQRSEAAATEDANTDDEDLQQLSMVMGDGQFLSGHESLLTAQGYLPQEVSYDEVQHVIFHHVKEQKPAFVDRLLKVIKKTPNGADTIARLVKAEDESGLTLLMISVRQDMLSLCELLVAEGADVNHSNDKRPMALLLAAQKGHGGSTRFLLEHGANDESKNLALIPAAHFGHLEVVRLLLEFGADQNYSNRKGTTPLMRAAQEGRDEVVQFLIDKDAVAYAANNEGMTALMLASQRGHANIATILINAGSDVNTQTRQGSTALLLAAKRGHTAAVEALLAAGADIFLKDDRQKTAAETAHRRGHVDLFLKITVSNQMRLIRERLRRERYAELMRLSHLYVLSRATLVPSFKSSKRQRLNCLLDRTMKLPRPLLQNIALYLPLCNVWDRHLKYLVYEAPFQPSKVVQHGIRIIDDILVTVAMDLRSSLRCFHQPNGRNASRHLALLRDNSEFREIFVRECQFRICPEVLERLRRMADIEGALASYAAGVGIQFGVEVAQDVVALVSDLIEWNDARKRAELFDDALPVKEEFDDAMDVKDVWIKKEEPSI